MFLGRRLVGVSEGTGGGVERGLSERFVDRLSVLCVLLFSDMPYHMNAYPSITVTLLNLIIQNAGFI